MDAQNELTLEQKKEIVEKIKNRFSKNGISNTHVFDYENTFYILHENKLSLHGRLNDLSFDKE